MLTGTHPIVDRRKKLAMNIFLEALSLGGFLARVPGHLFERHDNHTFQI
jgi:hypothetical protein